VKYFIITFGCQQNKADSERIDRAFKNRGFTKARSYKNSNYVIVNTCMVRESAENRVYGLVNNLGVIKESALKKGILYKIIITGCMIGLAYRDKTGKFLKKIKNAMPAVDEFMPIEEVGFDSEPVRTDKKTAWVTISNGCNNFCTFCVVPMTRGREVSRPYEDILEECKELKKQGYTYVTLLGQNVNSYGADLILGQENIQAMRDLDKVYFDNPKHEFRNTKQASKLEDSKPSGLSRISDFGFRDLKPVYVKHLGRYRLPTLFPHLLDAVAKLGFKTVDFISSNPWDFSDELIDVIARNSNISRTIHFALQSGDNNVLKRMNRWYTREKYLELVEKMRTKIPGIRFTTDIIVGFCGETEEEYQNTVDLCKKVGFYKAFIARYSLRPLTAATKVMKDDIPATVKKKRWQELDRIVNFQYY
jgi:tRNA-2-methylthio-N6-dimethylallyladenosine synthase